MRSKHFSGFFNPDFIQDIDEGFSCIVLQNAADIPLRKSHIVTYILKFKMRSVVLLQVIQNSGRHGADRILRIILRVHGNLHRNVPKDLKSFIQGSRTIQFPNEFARATILLSLPITGFAIDLIWRVMMMEYSGWISPDIPFTAYITTAALALASYLVTTFFLKIRLNRIPLDEALKNVE